jgi:hypothetical protein
MTQERVREIGRSLESLKELILDLGALKFEITFRFLVPGSWFRFLVPGSGCVFPDSPRSWCQGSWPNALSTKPGTRDPGPGTQNMNPELGTRTRNSEP